MKETWKAIPGWEGRYEISDLGNVRSLSYRGVERKQPLIMKTYICEWGYLHILFCSRGEKTHYRIASLVLLAFVGPRPEGKEVSHLDGVRTNNKLSNLIYETKHENHQRKKEHGTYQCGEKNPFHKLTNKDVLEIRRLRKCGKSLNDIAAKYNVSDGHVSRICLGGEWQHLLPKSIRDLEANNG
jgi:hypothetical protein